MNHLRVLPVLLLVATAALLAGCGGSVADYDRPRSAEETRTAADDPPFCSAVAASGQALVPLQTLASGGGGAPQEVADAVAAVRQANTQVSATAPAEIRADVDVYLRTMNLQLDALAASGGDGAALSRDSELSAQVNSPESVSASDQVREYVEQNCSPVPARG